MDGVLLKRLMIIAVALLVGGTIRCVALYGADRATVRKKLGSLAVWWVLLAILVAITIAGQRGAALFLGVVAIMAWREFMPWVVADARDRRVAIGAGVLMLVNLYLITGPYHTAADWFLPVSGLLWIGGALAIQGRTDGFLRTAGGLYFGMMLFGYGLAHGARLWDLPTSVIQRWGGISWFLFVFILTQANDIYQALVGRRFGRHKITPVVSPHKTWEGFLAGVVLTSVTAIVLGPGMTPLGSSAFLPWIDSPGRTWVLCAAAGALLSISGFAGDVVLSAVKRDVGVKDSGKILPGQGGVIDRIDSLAMTLTVSFWLLRMLGGAP